MRGYKVRHAIALSLCLVGLMGCSLMNRAPNNYIVFFNAGGSDLSPAGKEIVDQAAATIKRSNLKMVAISTGVQSGDNLRLAEPRFAAVQKELIADGVSPSLIARANLTATQAQVGTPGDQRVEILLIQN